VRTLAACIAAYFLSFPYLCVCEMVHVLMRGARSEREHEGEEELDSPVKRSLTLDGLEGTSVCQDGGI
jgi:hypothetical protein